MCGKAQLQHRPGLGNHVTFLKPQTLFFYLQLELFVFIFCLSPFFKGWRARKCKMIEYAVPDVCAKEIYLRHYLGPSEVVMKVCDLLFDLFRSVSQFVFRAVLL